MMHDKILFMVIMMGIIIVKAFNILVYYNLGNYDIIKNYIINVCINDLYYFILYEIYNNNINLTFCLFFLILIINFNFQILYHLILTFLIKLYAKKNVLKTII